MFLEIYRYPIPVPLPANLFLFVKDKKERAHKRVLLPLVR
jgi:hypothetical protein